MIHVLFACPPSRHGRSAGARHIVTLLRMTDRVERPGISRPTIISCSASTIFPRRWTA